MKKISAVIITALLILALCSCSAEKAAKSTTEAQSESPATQAQTQEAQTQPSTDVYTTEATTQAPEPTVQEISFDEKAPYAAYSKIHTDSAVLYRSSAENKKNKVICINAGHGCKGGSSVYTKCHPDGSPKVSGGSTQKGASEATSINEGTSLLDGTDEADANLALALTVKDALLENGYDVLMLREDEDAQLDNIARAVIANSCADCHISLHYDSTENDKGLFYIGVPDVQSYLDMEPVKSHYKEHRRLGESLVDGERTAGVKIFNGGCVPLDLTQTSYSTIPSVCLEVGDRASDHSEERHKKIAEGIVLGLNTFFTIAYGK